MGEAVKQINLRLSQENIDKFKIFCEENGFSQAQGFDQMLHAMELSKAREAIPGRATEIDEFSLHAKAIIDAYLSSLEINANAEARIREEFTLSLQSKDKTIADLQEKLEAMKTAKNEAEQIATSASQNAAQAMKDYSDAAERAKTMSKLVAEKDKTINSLAEKLTVTEEKLAGYTDLKENEKKAQEKTRELEHALKDLKKDHDVAIKELQSEMERKISYVEKDAALATATAVAENERKIRDVYEQKLRDVDKENARLLIKLEQLKSTVK